MFSRAALATAYLTAVCFPAIAYAQAAQMGSASASESTPGDIVVTAQRRQERLRDVPIAITALDGHGLAASGISTTVDLAAVVPGLSVPLNGGYAQPSIRGISTNSTSVGVEPSVAIYVDGVYAPNQAASVFELNDIERIEVLKGPQGTLFGRNAVGGAISITTLDPKQDFSAKFGASYGSFHEVKLDGYVTGGITDDVAASLSMLYRHDDGYAQDFVLDKRVAATHDFATRGKLRIDATDRLQFLVSADYDNRYDGTGYALKPEGCRSSVPDAACSTDPQKIALSFVPFLIAKTWGTSVHTKYSLDGATITAITAYRDVKSHLLTDIDRTNLPISSAESFSRGKTFTQEVNIASGANRPISWIAGLYYFRDDGTLDALYVNNVPTISSEVLTNAYAGYAEVNAHLTRKLTLIGGLRYSYETKDYDAIDGTGTQRTDTSHHWHALTPRAALRYSIDDHSNVYASYSRGFKSGAYNAQSLSAIPVNQETIDGYEIGYKRSSHGITFNSSAFYYKYKNIQLQATTGSTGLTAFFNAARAEIYGADAEINARVIPSLDVRGGLAWTHARYTNFDSALITTPLPGGGNSQGPGDASGNKITRTPTLTLDAGATFRSHVAGGDFELTGDAYYNDGFFWDPGNRFKQSAYVLVNATASWKPAGSPVRFSVWGRNLTNETYGIYGTDTTFADAVAYSRPRSVGVAIAVEL